jgi:hypothetical protein
MRTHAFITCFLCTSLFCALAGTHNAARGGAELIGLACQQYSVYVNNVSDLVPVSVTLINGSADYIDMTYSAQDTNGNSVTCTPSTNRFHLSKGQKVVDNVVVNAGPIPVVFTATAQGEAPNGDYEASQESLAGFTFGGTSGFTTSATGSTQLTQPYIVLPVSGTLTTATAGQYPQTWVYDATYGASPTYLHLRPRQDQVNFVVNTSAPSITQTTRSVLVHLDGQPASSVTFALSKAGTQLLTYNLGTSTVQQTSAGGVNFSIGPPTHVSRWNVPIQFTPSYPGPVKIFYSASDGTNSYDCSPKYQTYQSTVANPQVTDNVKVDVACLAGTTVTVTAIAVDGDQIVYASGGAYTINVP